MARFASSLKLPKFGFHQQCHSQGPGTNLALSQWQMTNNLLENNRMWIAVQAIPHLLPTAIACHRYGIIGVRPLGPPFGNRNGSHIPGVETNRHLTNLSPAVLDRDMQKSVVERFLR
jgi:hypothetical protein